jgi:proteasome accessory factor A
MGTTSLVLAMIEDRALDVDLTCANRAHTARGIARPGLRELVELRDGRTMTAVQLLWIYYEQADRYLRTRHPGAVDDGHLRGDVALDRRAHQA